MELEVIGGSNKNVCIYTLLKYIWQNWLSARIEQNLYECNLQSISGGSVTKIYECKAQKLSQCNFQIISRVFVAKFTSTGG